MSKNYIGAKRKRTNTPAAARKRAVEYRHRPYIVKKAAVKAAEEVTELKDLILAEEAEPEIPAHAEEDPEEPVLLPDGSVERKVLIRSSRGDVVIENQLITLTSKLIGFDDVDVHYQWQVDRGDGNGWVDVEGATGADHSFAATKDTILYSWRLIITTDE